MNLQDDGFSLVWIVGGWLLYLLMLLWAFRTAPWFKVVRDNGAQHVFLGATLVIFVVWNMAATLGGGVSFHFLLMTVMVLMFGPQLALILASLALLGVTAWGSAGVLVFGLNALLMGLIPVLVTWAIVYFAYRFLEHNFFVFVLLNGFFAAVLSSFLVLMIGGMVLWLSEVQSVDVLRQSFFPYIPLMIVPEGFVSGMIIGALMLLKPEWIGCYSDELYLKGK